MNVNQTRLGLSLGIQYVNKNNCKFCVYLDLIKYRTAINYNGGRRRKEKITRPTAKTNQ